MDDPSTDVIVDPNDAAGPRGRDNRGTLAAGLKAPGPPVLVEGGVVGYRGRLGPAGSNPATVAWVEEGASLAATTGGMNANGIAAVDLAVSFNAGDNFRVVAAPTKADIDALNDLTSVPTTGNVAITNGAASPQLSVWRRFHIEHDRMAPIDRNFSASGRITSNPEPGFGERAVTTEPRLPDRALGATMWLENGSRFVITRRADNDPNGVFLVITNDNNARPKADQRFEVHHGDWQSGRPEVGSGNWIKAKITDIGQPTKGWVAITLNIAVLDADAYRGGIMRIADKWNHPILSNDGSALGVHSATFYIPTGTAIHPKVNDSAVVYQDEFTPHADGRQTLAGLPITQVQALGGTRYKFSSAVDLGGTDRFAGGMLWASDAAYRIDKVTSNNGSTEVEVTMLTLGASPAVGTGMALFRKLTNNAPEAIINTATEHNMYGMLSPSTSIHANVYAAAYLVPDKIALAEYSKVQLPGMGHLTSNSTTLGRLVDTYRGQEPGGPARDANYETDLFWSVYVSTAFEADLNGGDGDPYKGRGTLGGTLEHPDNQDIRQSASFVFLATILDCDVPPLAIDYVQACVTAHEIGHQFGLAYSRGSHEGHRDEPPNLMSTYPPPPNDCKLHRQDIVGLRRRVGSPDGRPIP